MDTLDEILGDAVEEMLDVPESETSSVLPIDVNVIKLIKKKSDFIYNK
jgi:hypothetical protein